MSDAQAIAERTGYPLLVRASFALGGSGASWVYRPEELPEAVRHALAASPIGQAWVEESVLGWKEYELEVMRDGADNFVVVCSIENLDPMGVHTGDSITVAPAQTLTDREYQRLRDLARRVMTAVGVETGGSNVQFAVNPDNGRVLIIEMNPRVSRSSALASKATGFPIAKIAALVAAGYTLDEITNDITGETRAAFEPSLDYVAVKIPRWAFEKFPGVNPLLGPQMKSVGEVMALGRTFPEALNKAVQSLEIGVDALDGSGPKRTVPDDDSRSCRARDPCRRPSVQRLSRAARRGGCRRCFRTRPVTISGSCPRCSRSSRWRRPSCRAAETAASLDGEEFADVAARCKAAGVCRHASRPLVERCGWNGVSAIGLQIAQRGAGTGGHLPSRGHLRRRVLRAHAVYVQRL